MNANVGIISESSQATNRFIDLNNATCTLDKSDVSQQCATDDTTVRKLFDLRNRCSEFGAECEPECECKRKLAKDTASKYYKLKSNLKKQSYSRMAQVQKSNTDQRYGGIEPYALDNSGYDPSQYNLKGYQTSSDMYLDYTNGKVVSIKPDHPYYKKTSAIEIRDPTCIELQSVMAKICTGEQEKDENTKLPYNEHSVGLVCGMGTTWNTKFQVCEKVPKQISDVEGTGQPFEEPTYPALRPSGYKTPFDDPNRKFAESNLQVPDIHTSRQLRQHRQSCGCRVNRCRYPLTSREGRNQARIFVQLFRRIYQYADWTDMDCTRPYPDDHKRKCDLRSKLREQIEAHFDNFNSLHNGLILFLPWHRWYLIEVESILLDGQKEFDGLTTSCNDTFLGIPYFDWHNLKRGETPMTFVNDENDFYGHHLHDSLGQRTYPRCYFSGRCRINEGELAWLPRVRWNTGYVARDWQRSSLGFWNWYPLSNLETSFHPQFLLPTQFHEFSCELEGRCSRRFKLHNFIHRSIGGDMDSDMSSNDPIFFVHHANVDKIWNDWQKQSDEHRNYYPGYKNQPIGLKATGTVQDFLDLLHIKYTSPIEQSIVNDLSIEYVDMDTSDDWGRGNTLTIDLESQERARREL